MILEDQYRKHLQAKNLAGNTIDNYISSIKRVERDNKVDLESELARDQMKGLVTRLTYSHDDQRSSKPNPSNMAIQPSNLFSDLGWYRRALQRYQEFRLGIDSAASPNMIDDVEEPEIEAAENTFKLEQDLHAAIRKNISQLENGLVVEDGGKEFQVESGFIDILARDKSGRWVVIELKAGTAKPESIAQILGYMACLSDVKNKAETRGILIAADFVPRVRHAARAVSSLELQKYRYNFSFEKG
jgi:hypothetical protein